MFHTEIHKRDHFAVPSGLKINKEIVDFWCHISFENKRESLTRISLSSRREAMLAKMVSTINYFDKGQLRDFSLFYENLGLSFGTILL